ncbi:hypothetical protein [Kribbella sp. VKM Ac-2568]|uniref:hypothetical protein n=1 Tax=Kribbella sp. VKM Ac-2568 TaxID=2512219 RepID=UPI001A7ED7AE|nr:hypothetical protein [Kribbella sp. VKM Ac-2568]
MSVGRPEAWSIDDLYRRAGTTPPSLTQAMLERYDLYLIRLACSFRPEHGKSRVDWARFELTLEPDDQGNQPLAEDLHPDVVDAEQKAHTKAVIGPSVKFQSVEVSVGNLEIGVEYTKLLPRISASGQFQANPAWDYFRVPGHDVVGGKMMHLIAKAPQGMAAATGTITLTADIETTGGIIRAILRRPSDKVAASLPVRLWP